MPAFFLHYNKPASAQRQKPTITVHWKGACHLVDNVVVNVPMQGRIRRRQPRFVMAGKANTMQVKKGVAYLE